MTDKSLEELKLFLQAIGILILCFLFIWVKEFFIRGGFNDSEALGIGFKTAVFYSWFSAITCYPAFFIGLYVKESPKLFCVLSWGAVALVFLGERLVSGNLSFSIGNQEVLISGDPTLFGLFYILFSPRFVMALWASWLYFRQKSR